MLTIQSSPRPRVNPYRIVRVAVKRLVLQVLPVVYLLWAVTYTFFPEVVYTLPDNELSGLQILAGLTTIFLGAIIVMTSPFWLGRLWHLTSGSFSAFGRWWKRQEAKYDKIED